PSLSSPHPKSYTTARRFGTPVRYLARRTGDRSTKFHALNRGDYPMTNTKKAHLAALAAACSGIFLGGCSASSTPGTGDEEAGANRRGLAQATEGDGSLVVTEWAQ